MWSPCLGNSSSSDVPDCIRTMILLRDFPARARADTASRSSSFSIGGIGGMFMETINYSLDFNTNDFDKI